MAQAQTSDYFERRREIRKPVVRKARMALVKSGLWQDCTILDESDSGAQIEVSCRLIANDEVTIEVASADLRLANVRWFAGTKAGLEFCRAPGVMRPTGERDVLLEQAFGKPSGTVQPNDDCIAVITPANILACSEDMGFIGSQQLLSSHGLGQAENLSQRLGDVTAQSLPNPLADEEERAADPDKLMLTGKQAAQRFAADLENPAISRDHLQQLTAYLGELGHDPTYLNGPQILP